MKMDRQYLEAAKEQIGGFFDTVMFNREAKRHLLLELPNFYTYNVTESYILFLSFLLQVVMKITWLWTNDYKNFIPNDGTLDDTYYPTNHVSLSYDQTLFPPPDLQRLTSLFYDLSPAPFVLQYLYTILTGKVAYTMTPYFHYPTPIKYGTNITYGMPPNQAYNPLEQPLG